MLTAKLHKLFSKVFLLILFFLTSLSAFEVVDEASPLLVLSGSNIVKYVTIYNFSKVTENLEVCLNLEKSPNLKKPIYQIDLAVITTATLTIPANKKMLIPVYINAYTRLEKGQYIYWLCIKKEQSVQRSEDFKIKELKTYQLPLIIVVK